MKHKMVPKRGYVYPNVDRAGDIIGVPLVTIRPSLNQLLAKESF